ncbi:MAG TPA: pyridoxal phosphate-dependent aminotransferase [Bryobacteraceae bacterium]|nr:pyridoxal phosphate-dependent aminotransferase [Bryobacteraceae bacterium]
MFSSRFPPDFQPNRLTRAVEAARRAGTPILDLTVSNPTDAGFRYPPEIVSAFEDPRMLRYEPTPAGLPEARAAVARYYAARGVMVDPERIQLTASTSEAYAYLFKLLANPGDHVLVPRPSYPLFDCLAAMESIELRSYSLSYDGVWSIDFDALTAAITNRTRAVILVNPNNPTGSFLKRAELERLAPLCAERRIALISDEVFSDYGFTADRERVTTLAAVEECLAFSMSGLSKIAGLPQMKLGWIVTAGPASLRAPVRERLEWIADTYLSVGTPVQHGAARLLAAGEPVQQQIKQRTQANLQFARNALAGSCANPLNVEGGWYVILQAPRIRTEEEWALELLARSHLLVQPGFFYDFESEAFLVISLLPEEAVFQAGITRLSRFLQGSSVQ